MDDTIDGREPRPGEPRRWDELGDALERALRGADPLLEAGAKFYPNPPEDNMGMPSLACRVDPGIDLIPARGNVDALIRFFETTGPSGGTPTADALVEVADFFAARPAPGVPRFVVLATDGGPNCNPDTGIPPGLCVCTGGPDNCDPALAGDFAAFNCLDRARTLTAVRAVSEGLGVPVFVIGIDDPSRPDLADVLDEIALAGGRPRGVPGEREFYSVREEEDLNDALGTITRSVAQCVFSARPAPGPVATLAVEIDGARVPRDEARAEGWDYTAPDRSEITLFGEACAQVTDRGGEVSARISCEP